MFYDGHVLGFDFTEPSWTVEVVDQTADSFTVDYSLYAAGQAPPAAPTGEKRITFVWDAERAKRQPAERPGAADRPGRRRPPLSCPGPAGSRR